MVVHSCEFCGKKFNKIPLYLNHIENKNTLCTLSNEYMDQTQNKNDSTHINNTKPKPKSNPKPIQCESCKTSFSRNDSLKRHYSSCKVRREEMEIKDTSDEEKNNNCKEINNCMDSNQQLGQIMDLGNLFAKLRSRLNINVESDSNSNSNYPNSNGNKNGVNNYVNDGVVNITDITLVVTDEDIKLLKQIAIAKFLYELKGTPIESKIIERIRFNPVLKMYEFVDDKRIEKYKQFKTLSNYSKPN
jgi:hypothetical protein